MTRNPHRIDVASLAASILCFFALMGCGDDEPPSPRGAGPASAVIISGEVHDAGGLPVVGANIYLAREEPSAASSPGTSHSSTEPLEMRRTLVGVTGADGRYAVRLAGPDDRDRTVWLVAEHADFAFSADAGAPLLVEARVGALPGPTLHVLRAGALIGRIEDGDGLGLLDLEVTLASPRMWATFRTRSGIDGVFRFPSVPEGPVEVQVGNDDTTAVAADVIAGGEVSVPDSLVADPAKGDE